MRSVGLVLKLIIREAWKFFRYWNLLLLAVPALLASPVGVSLQHLLGSENPVSISKSQAAIVAAAMIVVTVITVLARIVVKQEAQLAPRVRIDFDPDGGSIVETPEKRKSYSGETLEEYRAVYLRALVRNESRKSASDCSAHLVAVERLAAGGAPVATRYRDPIQLAWSHIGQKDIDLHERVPRYVDLLKTTDTGGLLQFTAGWPLTLRKFFSDPATYRMTIIVIADRVAHEAKIDVVWNGKWDQVSGEIVRA